MCFCITKSSSCCWKWLDQDCRTGEGFSNFFTLVLQYKHPPISSHSTVNSCFRVRAIRIRAMLLFAMGYMCLLPCLRNILQWARCQEGSVFSAFSGTSIILHCFLITVCQFPLSKVSKPFHWDRLYLVVGTVLGMHLPSSSVCPSLDLLFQINSYLFVNAASKINSVVWTD